jgi:hypothetical protein
MDLVPLQDIAPRTFWAASIAAVACTMTGWKAAVSPDHSPPRPAHYQDGGMQYDGTRQWFYLVNHN